MMTIMMKMRMLYSAYGRTVLTAALIILISLAASFSIWMSGLTLNHNALQAQIELLDNAISQKVASTINEQKSVALWDEAARVVSRPNKDKEWIDLEIGGFLFEAYGHDAVYMLDAANQPFYAYVDGKGRDSSDFERYRTQAVPMIDLIRTGRGHQLRERASNHGDNKEQISYGARNGRWDAHVINDNGKAALLSVITIIPMSNKVPLPQKPALLVSIVHLDQQALTKLGTGLMIRDLQAASTGHAKGTPGIFKLTDDNGQEIAPLFWTARRPGDHLLYYVLPLAAFITIVIAFFLIRNINRMTAMNSELIDRERHATYLANHDAMTALPNRRYFLDYVNDALKSQPTCDNGAYLAVVNLTQIKQINDVFGHATGDEIIKKVAASLEEAFEASSFTARLGGDEFGIFTSEILSIQAFRDRLKLAVSRLFQVQDQEIRIGCNVGIAIAHQHGKSALELMKSADIALTHARENDSEVYAIYEESMGRKLRERRNLEDRIERATRSMDFELWYQPIVNLRERRVVGHEALIRWASNDSSPIGPAQFIPIVEAMGLMPKLGDWVIRQAMKDSLRFPGLWMSINLSPLQIQNPKLVSQIQKHLKITGADPNSIYFEMTEGVLIQATTTVHNTLEKLQGMGFKLALDDFGTGYSSLSYLREFEFDKVKVDRSFIREGKVLDRKNASLIRAVVDVARALDMTILAEGVEEIEEAKALLLLGCEEIQGWLCGKAEPIETAIRNVMLFNNAGENAISTLKCDPILKGVTR